MYIEKLLLENIRCLDSLSVEMEKPGESILFVGDNGDGKSSVLRSIAMGLCDESSSASLLRELPGEFVKNKKDEAAIEIYLRNGRRKRFKIITKILSLKEYEKVKQTIYEEKNGKFKKLSVEQEKKFPWNKIFVSAYGAGARTQGTEDFQHYFSGDAVYTLFNYDALLQNPELVVRRLIARARERGKGSPEKGQELASQMWETVRESLGKVLSLKKEEIELSSRGLNVRHRGKMYELGSVGDGYRSTTTWVLDLISWAMLNRNWKSLDAISGIVIVDEIEQHLHPQWQLKILESLRDVFPKIQFIITTHSPLVVSGTYNIPIIRLDLKPPEKKFADGWLAEDVYREILGLSGTRPQKTEDLISRIKKLNSKKLNEEASGKELNELNRLKKALNETLPSEDPIILTNELKNLTELLKKS